MKKKGKYFLFLCLIWFLVHTTCISWAGLHDKIAKADCLLILGNKVNENGSLSLTLKSRLDKGLELYRNHYAPFIVVSGGLGKEGYYEGTEMKKYLILQGIEEKAVLVDNHGDNTLATARNFETISTEKKFRSVLVVSQFFHISRTALMLRQRGIDTIYHAHATYYEWKDAYSLIREFFGYYKFLIFKY